MLSYTTVRFGALCLLLLSGPLLQHIKLVCREGQLRSEDDLHLSDIILQLLDALISLADKL